MEIDEETLNDIIAKLNEAQDILLKTISVPNMTVTEFNATPPAAPCGAFRTC